MEELEKRVNEMPPLTWAYIGDAIYEVFIREHLINTTKLNAHRLHLESIKHVKASAQASMLKKIEGELTEEEKDIVRRTRNTKNHHLPKNANVNDYMYATAFEGLVGYLYLIKREKRLKEILNKTFEN